MKIAIAYLGVLIIWSTTPLAIKWSSEDVHFLLSVCVRMSLATLVVLPVVLWKTRKLPMNIEAIASYLSGSLGMCVAMSFVYWASQHVSTGIISVMFGFTPLLTGVFAYFIFQETFSPRKVLGICFAISGLAMIFVLESEVIVSVEGIAALFLAAGMYGLSNVLVKRINASVTPLQQTTGTLLVTSMVFIWFCFLQQVPLSQTSVWVQPENIKSMFSLMYLVLICSAIGFFLMFYVLSVMSAGAVSLITLMTPVLALYLGNVLNSEHVGVNAIAGSICIGLGLVAYEWPKFVALLSKCKLFNSKASTTAGFVKN